jgi:hypothetical protein
MLNKPVFKNSLINISLIFAASISLAKFKRISDIKELKRLCILRGVGKTTYIVSAHFHFFLLGFFIANLS